MDTKTKAWLIAAVSLILFGITLFGGVMTALKWDFTKLSTVRYETNEHTPEEPFENIRIVTDTADISFVPTEGENVSVVCHEPENEKHTVSVKDGTLTVEVTDTQKWYERIGVNFETPKITVCLRKGQYGTLFIKESTGDIAVPGDFSFASVDITASTGDVTNLASASAAIKITTSTGDIRMENVSAETADLSVSTGRITVSSVICEGDVSVRVSTGKATLTGIQCKDLDSSGNTGAISLSDVIADGRISIVRTTGDVTFESTDAAEISVRTDTGDVTGSFLSEKVFLTKTDTGRIRVPKTLSGGKCEITTDTGDIIIHIK